MRAFADTNVTVYAYSDDGEKTAQAIRILEGDVAISTQVVNETVSVLTCKHGFSLGDAHQVATQLLIACAVDSWRRGDRSSSRSAEVTYSLSEDAQRELTEIVAYYCEHASAKVAE